MYSTDIKSIKHKKKVHMADVEETDGSVEST